MRKRVINWTRTTAALGAGCALFLSACGGGSTSSGGATPAASASGSAVLDWDPVVASNLAGYRVHYGTAAGSYSLSVDTGTSTASTIANLAGGTRYYFVVAAVDSNGQEGSYSNEVYKDIP